MSNRIDNIFIPDDDASCQAWKHYFEALTKKYGVENAREAWLYTFNQKGNDSCTKDKAFNSWAAKNEIAVADGFDKAVAGISGIGQNIIKGVGTLTGLTPKLAAAVLVGGVGIALYLAIKIAREISPKDVIEQLPAGKLTRITKTLKR